MTERVAIDSIRIEKRRREDVGDIAALARNIDQHGLIHPIVITDDNVLIAGERRLRAHQHLNLTTIDARRWLGLDENQRREIELAENLDRKDLTPAERSRQMAELAEVAAESDRSEFRGKTPRNLTGRPQEPGSLRRIAERLNVDEKTIRNAKEHVAAIDAYPELTPLPQSDALKIAAKLDAMPEPERIEARAAVIAHEPATMARLTDRPPMPNGMSPHERAAKDPAVRFQTDLHDLWKRLNGVRDYGGIARVTAAWSREQRMELLVETERIAELMGEWYVEIKEQLI